MNSQQPANKNDSLELQQLLSQGQRPQRWHYRWLIAAVLGMVALGYWLSLDSSSQPYRYNTEPVIRGALVVKVSATGNLQPTNQVDVGSELSGIIEAVYVDDNDQVSANQILAQLDRSKLNDAVAISSANLAAAQAKVLQAEATLAETTATVDRYREVARLSGGKVPSKFELDAADANRKRAAADLASAKASVTQARASLQSNQTDLDKALIRSPINGVVLSREVEPGQTVAASFQAPVLFTLAEDLSQMELQVDVDEADVGQVQIGQSASFTVDAWSGRSYPATITRIGFGATESTDGVVSYPATLTVDNSDLSLRPGMTATAEIITLERSDALLVANAALRFSPPVAATDKKTSTSLVGALMPRPPRSKSPQTALNAGHQQQLWVLDNGQPKALQVTTGASDGRYTEITGGELSAGMAVITEAVSKP